VTYLSLSQAARVLDIDRRSLSHIVQALGLRTLPHPNNGLGKALTRDQVALIRRRLRPVAPAGRSSAPAVEQDPAIHSSGLSAACDGKST
jgi:hypothetical protein